MTYGNQKMAELASVFELACYNKMRNKQYMLLISHCFTEYHGWYISNLLMVTQQTSAPGDIIIFSYFLHM